MPRLSIEAKRRIVSLYFCRYSVPVIVQRLEQEDTYIHNGLTFRTYISLVFTLFIHVQPKTPWPVKISAIKITCMRLLKRYLINSVWRSL